VPPKEPRRDAGPKKGRKERAKAARAGLEADAPHDATAPGPATAPPTPAPGPATAPPTPAPGPAAAPPAPPTPAGAPAAAAPTPDRARPLRRLLRGIEGPRLCYGEPVTVDGRTVITVARVRAGGAGLAGLAPGAGAGGVDAIPLGFIELSAGEARFHGIDLPPERPRSGARAAAAAAAAAALGALALARRARAAPALPRARR